MICNKCNKEFDLETTYNPTTEKNDSPFITYMHGYSLSEIINNPKVCKNSLRIKRDNNIA